MYKPRQRTKVDKDNVDAGEDKVFDGQWNQFYSSIRFKVYHRKSTFMLRRNIFN